MTAVERVARTQRLIGAAAITRALAWGFAVTLTVLAGASFVALIAPAIASDESSHVVIALMAGVSVAAALAWRSRHFVSRNRVALWIEERIPSLHYSLVTAIEHGSSPFSLEMERVADCAEIESATLESIRKALLPAAAALLGAALLLYVSPSAAFGRAGIFPHAGRNASVPHGPVGSRLERIAAEILPPSYSGEKSTTLDDPTMVSALVGSRIVVRGDGSSDGITASISGVPVSTKTTGRGWSLAFSMPAQPTALALRDRQYERIVVIDPRHDAPPRIVLTSPAKDTTLRAAQLVIRLTAIASDDVGLRDAYFEYLITTGSGEIFNARTVTTPVVAFVKTRSDSISATLDLGSLQLGQGDVVSIRAIARDGNTVTGPGIGTSDTRTFRIARAGEYDSVAVDAAAPQPVDTAAMSQRMLIIATEKLVREKKRISRKELVRRSGEIGDLEDKIRKRVEEILYENEGAAEEEDASAPPEVAKTLEGEESDQVHAVKNPDLYEAFNALWAAVRSLQIAEPDSALPPMRAALKALDRVRLANRLYLRGTPPPVIVDLARVRMSGKEKGNTSTRSPRTPSDSARVKLERRFSDAVELIASRPADAVRAFTLMQVEALSVSPQLASALGEAVEAFRRGRDATLPLVRARRALSGNPSAAPGLPGWTGAW